MKDINFSAKLAFVFCVLLGCGAFSNPHRINEFTPLSAVNDGRDHLSTSSNFYLRNSDQTRWIFKENPKLWIINEFIASALYRFVLGDVVAESMLVRAKGKVLFATKETAGFIPFDNHLDIVRNDIPFECAYVRTDARCSNMKIVGGELAMLTSLWFAEHDVYQGYNYALVATPDSDLDFRVTRYDFDDSLKFFEIDSVAEIVVPQVWENKVGKVGAQNYARADMLADLGCTVEELERVYKFTRDMLGNDEFLAAFRALRNVNILQLKKIIHDRVDELRFYFSRKELKNLYRFPQSIHDEDVFLNLSEYIVEMLLKRYELLMEIGKQASNVERHTSQL